LPGVLRSLAILDLHVERKHERTRTDTTGSRTRDTVKGVACKTRSEPGCKMDTENQKNVFTYIAGRQKRHLIVLAFLLYED